MLRLSKEPINMQDINRGRVNKTHRSRGRGLRQNFPERSHMARQQYIKGQEKFLANLQRSHPHRDRQQHRTKVRSPREYRRTLLSRISNGCMSAPPPLLHTLASQDPMSPKAIRMRKHRRPRLRWLHKPGILRLRPQLPTLSR